MDIQSRYNLLKDKERSEEIVLLQGKGCFWKKCSFCDYYLDSDSKEKRVELDLQVLDQVTGETGWLTVINSGSFFELDSQVLEKILSLLNELSINDLSIEAHYIYKDKVKKLKEYLAKEGIRLHTRIGIETFDEYIRETVFNKGMGPIDLEELTDVFDECCLLFGIEGQTIEQIIKDLDLALENFDAVYLNIFKPTNQLKRDDELIVKFRDTVYPKYKDRENLHVLFENTDLGVG